MIYPVGAPGGVTLRPGSTGVALCNGCYDHHRGGVAWTSVIVSRKGKIINDDWTYLFISYVL